MESFFKKKCSNNWFINFLVEKRFRFWRHFIVLCYVALTFVGANADDSVHKLAKSTMWSCYFLAMFYFNMYVLVPKLLYRNRYVFYILALFVTIISGYMSLVLVTEVYMDGYTFSRSGNEVPIKSGLHQYFVAIHMIVLMVFASTSIKLFQRWAIDSRRINELETNSLQLELRELRNQVNPHFLFNMLNNANVLVRKNPDQAIATIHKLSDFLRYQLYENNSQSVLLMPEIQFLRDLLELEKMRRDDFEFELRIQNNSQNPDKAASLMLPPNLFISFVENAIKHSADSDNPTWIKAIFSIGDDSLSFRCENSKPTETRENKTGGLGLSNVKRRLDLLYAHDYSLDISESEGRYEINLTLPLWTA